MTNLNFKTLDINALSNREKCNENFEILEFCLYQEIYVYVHIYVYFLGVAVFMGHVVRLRFGSECHVCGGLCFGEHRTSGQRADKFRS